MWKTFKKKISMRCCLTSWHMSIILGAVIEKTDFATSFHKCDECMTLSWFSLLFANTLHVCALRIATCNLFDFSVLWLLSLFACRESINYRRRHGEEMRSLSKSVITAETSDPKYKLCSVWYRFNYQFPESTPIDNAKNQRLTPFPSTCDPNQLTFRPRLIFKPNLPW